MINPHISPHHIALILAALLLSLTHPLCAQNNEVAFQRNLADEAIAENFSADRAIDFIEDSVSRWQTNRKCVTCHTNGLHLVTASLATPSSKVFLENRKFAREYVSGYVSGKLMPSRQHGAIAGIVATSSFLAISEMTTGGELHPDTAAALDHAWKKQSPSGAWDNWLKCHWGPFEVDDHYGVTLATIALSMTPAAYQKTEAALAAKIKLKQFLQKNPPTSLHQKGMLLWASNHDPTLSSPDQIKDWIKELQALQQKDGGWVLIQLGNQEWQRDDGKAQHQMSDGYATAFSIFVLRQARVETNDPAIQSGLHWLKSNQRESGRWFTHSPRRDGKHYITQAATNMALLALASCDELPQ
jgi:squalene-hopene/tetraprenyl-beta-curcumene cyclase